MTRLTDAHQSALNNSTYQSQVEWDQVSGVSDDTFTGFEVNPLSMNITSGPNSSLFRLVGDDDVSEYWGTKNTTTIKTSIDSPQQPPIYQYHNTGLAREFEQEASTILHEWLNTSTYEYTGTVARNNQTLHEFWATGLRRNTTPIENTHARVLVDQEGVIHDAIVARTYHRDNSTVTARLQYATQRNGTAPPPQPDWVTAELPHLDASVIGNGTVIALEHTGGTSVSNATMKTFFPDRTQTDTEIDDFEPGATLYLYRLQDTSDQLRVSKNEAPAVNDSFAPVGEDTVFVSVIDWPASFSGDNRSLRIEVEPRKN